MSDAIRSGARALICDSVDDTDLDGIVEGAWTLDGPVLWVGSAGLAGALARRMGTPPAAADTAVNTQAEAGSRDAAAIGHGASGPVIMWIGSHHPATVAQQQFLLSLIHI